MNDTSNLFFICFTDPCLVQYCMKGRECVLENGEPKCICQKQCPPHRRAVCGSDGKVYTNHCELHRVACMQSTAITSMRGTHCVKFGKYFRKKLNCNFERINCLLNKPDFHYTYIHPLTH